MFESVCPKKSWEKMKRSVENPVPYFGTNADKSCQTSASEDAAKIIKTKKVKTKNQDFVSLMYPAHNWTIFR